MTVNPAYQPNPSPQKLNHYINLFSLYIISLLTT
jgi:hypothetical protein